MNETDITQKCMKGAKALLPGCVCLKHQDGSTNAVPDWTCSWQHTHWIEMKYVRKGERLKDKVSTDQLILGHQLALALDGRAWVVVFEEAPDAVSIWQPSVLFRHLYPNVAGAGVNGRKNAGAHGLGIYDPKVNLANMVQIFGAIRLDGWDYNVVAHLIKDRVNLL